VGSRSRGRAAMFGVRLDRFDHQVEGIQYPSGKDA
jgi:hypothetical protein